MSKDVRTFSGLAIALAFLLLVCASGVVLGQGGTGREVTPAPAKKTTTTKKAPALKPTRTNTPGSTPPQTSTQPTSENTEPEYWETIRNSGDGQDFKDYLQTYQNGAHAGIARTKI